MTQFALKRPVTVLMLFLGLGLLGVISWQRLPVQLLPQFILPEVSIQAGLPGGSPEQVERELVVPIEGELATLAGVEEIESRVFTGAANVRVVFRNGTNMKFAILKLQQKINALKAIVPPGSALQLNRFDTADLSSFLMQLSLRGQQEAEALREIAEQRVRPQLEQVEGVVNVMVGGGRQSTISIDIDDDRCEALHLPVVQIQQKVNAFHRQPQHLGRVLANGRFIDVTLAGRMDDLSELRDLIISPQGPIRLRDVARVDYSYAEQTEFYRINGKTSVGLFVRKDQTSNMLQVADDVLQKIAELNHELARDGLSIVVNFSQAQFIQEAIDRVVNLALTGAVLAMLVLFLFLRNVRFVLILMIAIPVSLLVTFNLMYGWSLSINIISLCGLALAIGMLVDNGIVVMENIFSHYQRGRTGMAATLQGTNEVRRSILAATITTILVFLPVFYVESQAKLFVRELALAVIFPLLVSLVVAMMIIPLLARHTLRGSPPPPFGKGRLLEIYRTFLKFALRHRIRTISVVLLLFVASLLFGVAVIITQAPPPPPDRLDVYVTMPRGATLQSTDAVVRRLEEQILEIPDLKEVRANVHEEEAHLGLTFVEIKKRQTKLNLEKIKQSLREKNRRLRGVEIAFERRGRGGRSGGGGDGIPGLASQEGGLRLRGHDMQQLRLLSDQIVGLLRTVPGVRRRSVRSDLRKGGPELQVRGDRQRLALFGVNMQQIMQAIWATRAEGSRAATPFYQGSRDVQMQFLLQDAHERQITDIEKLKIFTPSGQQIPLREIADIRVDEGRGNIIRFNQERQAEIHYEFMPEVQKSKTRLEEARQQIDRLLRTIRLPKGFTLEKIDAEHPELVYYWMLAIGVLLIYMYLAAQFESFTAPVIILGTIPTAITGALLLLAFSNTPLSLGESAPMALLGLIVLLGIVVNNGIILLDRIAVLRNVHGYRWQRAVLTAAQSRVRPILMTSVTTILGVFPLALKQGEALELWPPFALTIVGGLAFSAASTLLFIPVLYVGLEQIKAWLAKIGLIGTLAGTAVAAGMMYKFHVTYHSLLYTGLLALPVWFSVLGVIYAVKQGFAVRREKARVLREDLRIQIINLTKIYGLPGKFSREWHKPERRQAISGGLPDLTPADLREQCIWLGGTGLLQGYLHTFFENGFWLLVLSLVTLSWAQWAVRVWRNWRRLRARTAVKKERDPERERKARRRKFSPAALRNPNVWLTVFFLVYLQLRVQSPGLTIVCAVVAVLIFRLKKISVKIADGIINPELPAGRLRKLKRLIYVLVQAIPIIRPARPQVVALKGVNLEISKGMFGLLGPNGAGKTTLMRSVVGVLEPDRGSIKVNGRDLKEHREIFHAAIGYLPQDFGLYENMTPLEFLNYHALLNGIYDESIRHERIEKILQGVGLWDKREAKIGAFSGGMKQRVGIAQTLLHLPQIIVVDEPTAGLDPKERIRFRNLLAELAKERIVLFSTHIVEDISSTCRDLAVLDRGQVIFRGAPEALQRRATGKVFEATVDETAFARMRKAYRVVQHSKSNGGVRVRFISESPVSEPGAIPVEPTLEDAYVLLLHGKK